ncbi:MAG: type II secretion system protein GspD [Puniceicoccales bacterium]
MFHRFAFAEFRSCVVPMLALFALGVAALRGAEPGLEVHLIAPDGAEQTMTLVPNETILSDEEIELARLRALLATDLPMRELPLPTALSLLASACEMNFLIVPGNGLDTERTVTMSVRANPFRVLKILTNEYGVEMRYDDGLWEFYAVNPAELISKTYTLKHHNLDTIKSIPPVLDVALGDYGNYYGSGRNRPGADGQAATSASDAFEISYKPITETIEKILSIPVTGVRALNAERALENLDNFPAQASGGGAQGQVFYLPDSNALLVIAARQHHDYIRAYLESLDQPQKLIRITTRFVETNLNPITDLGIDWAGVSGANVTASNLEFGPYNLNNPITNPWPQNALISVDDLSWQLNFLNTDRDTAILQEPVVVTRNNKPVSLQTVTLVPIEQGNTQAISSATSTISTNVVYIEIGTIINIFPTIMEGAFGGTNEESVRLTISLVVSNQIDNKNIRGSDFPVIASRNYDYSVVVPDGYTLAIGGLTENRDRTDGTSVPGLSEIPLLGELFKNERSEQEKRNLIAYITPEVIHTASGVPSITSAGVDQPQPPSVFNDFFQKQSPEAVRDAEGWNTDNAGTTGNTPRDVHSRMGRR